MFYLLLINVRKENTFTSKAKNLSKQQNLNALVNKFQITCPSKLVEIISIIQ